MFKKTLNFSELKSDSSSVSGLEDGEVLQIIHRGNEIKVMMTQEYFFAIMAKLEKSQFNAKSAPHNSDKLLSDFNSKLKKITDILDSDENLEKVRLKRAGR